MREKFAVKTMGSAAQGQYESMLGPYAMKQQAAWKRVEEAEAVSRGLVQYLRESADEVRAHVAWVVA